MPLQRWHGAPLLASAPHQRQLLQLAVCQEQTAKNRRALAPQEKRNRR